jgi:hypothetical protein
VADELRFGLSGHSVNQMAKYIPDANDLPDRSKLADQITRELQFIVGQPLGDCWRAANMQIFGFGQRVQPHEPVPIRLHVQCRWRFVDQQRIIFARDDINAPADETIDPEEFDWDREESLLDAKSKEWFAERSSRIKVIRAAGDVYGGFRIDFEKGFALEAMPCDSNFGEYSEHWRIFGHRGDESHFVITGYGVESKT